MLEVRRRSYIVGAQLIGSEAIRPLSETLKELQSCEERFVGAFVPDHLARIVSRKFHGATIDIHRLATDPAFFP